MKKLSSGGKERIVFSGKIFEIIKKPFGTGKKIIEFEIARRPPGVRLIIVDKNKILITKEYRYEIKDYDYRLPGGKIFDELEEYKKYSGDRKKIMNQAISAAKRECLEETGLKIKKIKHLHTSTAGLTVEWDLYYFLVEDFEQGNGQNLEIGEVIHPEWKTFDEVKKLCLKGKIREDRSVGVLLRFLDKKIN